MLDTMCVLVGYYEPVDCKIVDPILYMDHANKMTSENVNIVHCSITEASLCRKKRDNYTKEKYVTCGMLEKARKVLEYLHLRYVFA